MSTQNFTDTKAIGEDVAERGRQLYDEKLKAMLEAEHTGRFVAIEPSTGDYFLGDTDADSLAHCARSTTREPLLPQAHQL